MLHLRHVQGEDYDRWLPLWEAYLAFYEQSLEPGVTRTAWDRFLDISSPMRCVGAFDGRDMLGFTATTDHPSTWATADCCYLEDLFVDPDHRGRGVARALIEHVHAEARARGCSRLYWVTQANNHTARMLYGRVADLTDFVQYRMPLNADLSAG